MKRTNKVPLIRRWRVSMVVMAALCGGLLAIGGNWFANFRGATAEAAPPQIPQAAEGVQAAVRARDTLNTLQQTTGGQLASHIGRDTGVYDFVRATGDAVLSADDTSATPEARAMAFLGQYGGLLGMTDIERDIAANRQQAGKAAASVMQTAKVTTDDAGATHVKLNQQYRGLRVFGAQVVVHLDKRGVTAVNGNYIPDIAVAVKAEITPERAAQIALATASKTPDASLQVVETNLSIYRLGLLEGYKGRSVLAYSVEVKGPAAHEQIWLNAENGTVINRIPLREQVLNRLVYSPTYDPAAPNSNIVMREGDPDLTPQTQVSTPIINLYRYAGQTYNLYRSGFGRDSFDGVGMNPQRTVLLANDQCPNAYWDGSATNYCPDFDKDDVVSHEWTHAYTQFTHGLIYSYQSGALNESYSDFFGEAVDLLNGVDGPGGTNNAAPTTYTISNGQYVPSGGGQRWRVGEDVQGLSQPAALGILRDMWTPAAFADPDKVSSANYHCDSSDGGGVHTNSGVPNLGFAILVDGRTYNGQTVTGIGLTRALNIYFRAMTVYQIESTNFPQHEQALRASCQDLIGQPLKNLSTSSATSTNSPDVITAATCQELGKAMAAVEMSRPPTQCNFQKLLNPNTPAECAGSTELFVEDWETGTDGWTLASTGTTAEWPNTNWVLRSNLPANPDNSGHPGTAAFAINPQIGQPNGGTCQPGGDVSGKFSITSPEITLSAEAEDAKLAFEHFVQTEVGADGGNVKISVNGGAFTLVPQAQYIFNAPAAALITTANGNTNPMAGEFAWTGANEGELSGSWGTTIINLANLTNPGDKIKVRFEFGQDGCNGNFGWLVDKVRVYYCPTLQAPTIATGADYTNPDTDGLYTLNWVRPAGATGPDQLQESTSCGPVFTDDAAQMLTAGANAKWTGSAQWLSQPDPGTMSMSYYIPDGASQNESLTMVNAIALPAGASSALTFTTRQGLENTYDIGHVEVSANGGAFAEVASYTGPAGTTPQDVFIGTRTINLTPFAGQSIKIRFRLTSDPFNVGAPAGWYIDNINVTASAFTDVANNIAGTSFRVSKCSAGTFCYRVRTTYTIAGQTAFSPWSNVVTTIANPTLAAPTASITAPANNATFNAGSNIAINADAADNALVTKVEFFRGATKLGEDTTAPYSFTINSAAVGSYAITAVATDNCGASTTSGVVNFTVNATGPGLAAIELGTTNNGTTQTLVGGCQPDRGLVRLTAPAPTGGQVVQLSSSNSAATVPASVTVAAGQTVGYFFTNTTYTPTTTTGAITGMAGGTSASQVLNVRPIKVRSLSLSPATVTGAATVNGTATLECTAPATITIDLVSSVPSVATVNTATLTINNGANMATFTANTTAQNKTRATTINATTGGQTTGAKLTVNP